MKESSSHSTPYTHPRNSIYEKERKIVSLSKSVWQKLKGKHKNEKRKKTFFHSLIQCLFPCVLCSPNPLHIHRQSASNNMLQALRGTKREYSFAFIAEASRWSNTNMFILFSIKNFVLSSCRFFRFHLLSLMQKKRGLRHEHAAVIMINTWI